MRALPRLAIAPRAWGALALVGLGLGLGACSPAPSPTSTPTTLLSPPPAALAR